jgi:hypothetical protein
MVWGGWGVIAGHTALKLPVEALGELFKEGTLTCGKDGRGPGGINHGSGDDIIDGVGSSKDVLFDV